MLAGNATVYLFANVVNAAIPFMLLPILTRYLSPAQYGLLGMFQTLMAVSAAMIGQGLPSFINRAFFEPDSEGEFPAIVFNCLVVLAACTALMAIMAVLFLDTIVKVTHLPVIWVFVAILTAGVNVLILIRLGIWQINNASIPFALLQICLSLINVGLSLLMVVFFKWGFEGRLVGQNAAICAGGVLALLLLHRDELIANRWNMSHAVAAVRFVGPLIPHLLGLVVLAMFDRLVIAQVLGLEQAGIYIVAVQLALSLGLVSDAVNKAYMPWLFRKLAVARMSAKRRIVAGTYVYFFVLICLVFITFLLASEIVSILVGEAFAAASVILGWLMLGQAFKAMYMIVANYIYYSKNTIKLSVTTVLMGGFHICLVCVMTLTHGLRGAAWSFAISMGLRLLVTWLVANKEHPMPWHSPIFVISHGARPR